MNLVLYLLGAVAACLALAMSGADFAYYTALIAATVVTIACIYDVYSYNVSRFGKRIALPLGSFFIIFLAQFNVVRGWTFSLVHDDYLIRRVGGLDPVELMSRALAWIALFIISFGLTYRWAKVPRLLLKWGDRAVIFKATDPDTIVRNKTTVLAASFAITLVCAGIIIGLSVLAGGADLSSVVDSAYIYMVPMIIYSTCLAFYGAILATARDGKFIWVVVLLLLYVIIAYFGRTLSQFRIYAITLPALILGYHVAQRKRLVLCLVGMSLAFPLVTYLGKNRSVANKDLQVSFVESFSTDIEKGVQDFFLAPYTALGGDFTTVDMFASVLKQPATHHPYGLSWLYVFAHAVPRAIWAGKPERGILIDTSYSESLEDGRIISLPYTPGVVGDAYLEGEGPFVFIIGAMFGFMYKWIDTLLLRRLMMFGPTMDYCVTYAAFLFVAFFSNRSLPYFIAIFGGFNIAGVFIGRFIVQQSIKMFGERQVAERGVRPRSGSPADIQTAALFSSKRKSAGYKAKV